MTNMAINDAIVLLDFTGIDYYGAVLLIFELGEITRFRKPNKPVSWVDLATSLYQSGNRSRMGRILKQGNIMIR